MVNGLAVDIKNECTFILRMKRVTSFTRNTLMVGVCAVIAIVVVVRMASQPVVTISISSSASKMQPSQDGFGFPNFSAAMTLEQFNTDDMVRIAGSEACANNDVENCRLTAQANAWAQMVNQARGTGHCEGFAVMSAFRYMESANPKTATLSNTGDTTHAIFRSFASQFFPDVRDETAKWISRSLREKLAAVASEIARGSLTYTLGLYTESGGHAVLPYAVEKIDPFHFVIRVYDSNWPGKNRFISVDLTKDEWTFSFAHPDPTNDPNPWTGNADDLDIASLRTRTQSISPVSQSRVSGTVLLIRSKSDDWSVETSTGTISADSTSVSRPKPLHIDNRRQIPEYVVHIPAGKLLLKMPSKTSAFVVGQKNIVRITSQGSPAPVSIDSAVISTPDADVTVSVASSDLALTIINAASEISISDNSISAQVSGSERSVVATEESPRVTVEDTGNGVEVRPGSELDSVIAELPAELQEPPTLPNLPPAETRDMSAQGYQVDIYTPVIDAVVAEVSIAPQSSLTPPFIETAATTTTSTSSTTTSTTVAPRSFFTTTTTVVTSTTMPAVQSGTSSTTVPPVSPVTTIPTTTTTTSSTTTTTTTTMPLTCATGGACTLGDIGPGGGRVFYIAPNGSMLPFRYMEVAPTNAATSIKWCNNDLSVIPGAFSRVIGSGAANSVLILSASACIAGSAAAAADSYVSPNGTSDWFLPSILELHEMYPNKSLVGMPSSRNFWSSSQNSNVYAEAQSYLDGGNPSWWKTNYIDYDVRAVRTFGTP